MMRSGLETSGSESQGRRCVLAIGVGASIPSRLLEKMQRRGAKPVVVASAAAAMTALAEARTHALIVQDPQRLACFDELTGAVSVYHPEVVVWAFQPEDGTAAGGRLFRVSRKRTRHSGLANGEPVSASGRLEGPRPPAPPTEQASGLSPPEGRGDGASADAEPTLAEDEPLITADELLMLLGPAHRAARSDAQEEGK